jgi:hypothetical protein
MVFLSVGQQKIGRGVIDAAFAESFLLLRKISCSANGINSVKIEKRAIVDIDNGGKI